VGFACCSSHSMVSPSVLWPSSRVSWNTRATLAGRSCRRRHRRLLHQLLHLPRAARAGGGRDGQRPHERRHAFTNTTIELDAAAFKSFRHKLLRLVPGAGVPPDRPCVHEHDRARRHVESQHLA
jgi:hypothetical protein